jgi:hypothetical protein
VGNDAKDEPSEDFSTVNGIRTGRQAYNPASCITIMKITMNRKIT